MEGLHCQLLLLLQLEACKLKFVLLALKLDLHLHLQLGTVVTDFLLLDLELLLLCRLFSLGKFFKLQGSLKFLLRFCNGGLSLCVGACRCLQLLWPLMS